MKFHKGDIVRYISDVPLDCEFFCCGDFNEIHEGDIAEVHDYDPNSDRIELSSQEENADPVPANRFELVCKSDFRSDLKHAYTKAD